MQMNFKKIILNHFLLSLCFFIMGLTHAQNFEYSIISEALLTNCNNVTSTFIITLKTPENKGASHIQSNFQACNLVFSPETNIKTILSAHFNGKPIETIICKTKSNFQFVIPSDISENTTFSLILQLVHSPNSKTSLYTITATNSAGGMNYYFDKEYLAQKSDQKAELLINKNIISKPCGAKSFLSYSEYDSHGQKDKGELISKTYIIDFYTFSKKNVSSLHLHNSSNTTVILTAKYAKGFEIKQKDKSKL